MNNLTNLAKTIFIVGASSLILSGCDYPPCKSLELYQNGQLIRQFEDMKIEHPLFNFGDFIDNTFRGILFFSKTEGSSNKYSKWTGDYLCIGK